MTVPSSKYGIIQEKALNNKDIEITTNGTYTVEDPYSGFGVVRVRVPEPHYTSLQITPSINTQTFTVDDPFLGYSPITVSPVTSAIDSNIIPQNIKKGVTILGVQGNVEFLTEELEITPLKTRQTYTPSSDGYSKVVVNGITSAIDGNILPENILQGIEILGVTGTAIESKETTRNIERNGIFEPPAGYTGFSSVEVNVELDQEALVVNPTTSQQTFTALDEYHGYTPVTVNAVTSSIDSNIQASNIKQGITILGTVGTCVELNAQQRNVVLTSKNGNTFTPTGIYNAIDRITVTPSNLNRVVTPTTNIQTIDIENSYSGNGIITINPVTSSIDANIIPANIRKNISILGVVGTLQDAEEGLQTKVFTVNENTATITNVTPDTGYVGLNSVTVDLSWIEQQLQNLNAGDVDDPIQLQDKTIYITGEESLIVVQADSGYVGLGTVILDCNSVQEQMEELRGQAINTNLEKVLNGSATELATDVSTIRAYACYNLSLLQTVRLNNALTINDYAFANTNLSSLTIATNSKCSLQGSHIFDNTPIASGTGTIYVPSSLVNQYKTDTNWSVYSNRIQSI